MMADVSPIALFSIGYALCLMTPGPNLLIIASVALERGARGTLPVCYGVMIGSLALATTILFLASSMPNGDVWNRLGRALGALLLLYVSWRLLFNSPARSGGSASRPNFALGFVTAGINPITGSFFASQFLAMHRTPTIGELGAIFTLIAAITFFRSILVAFLFDQNWLRGKGEAWLSATWIRSAIGLLFAGIAISFLFNA